MSSQAVAPHCSDHTMVPKTPELIAPGAQASFYDGDCISFPQGPSILSRGQGVAMCRRRCGWGADRKVAGPLKQELSGHWPQAVWTLVVPVGVVVVRDSEPVLPPVRLLFHLLLTHLQLDTGPVRSQTTSPRP